MAGPRRPSVAGSFYPAHAAKLAATVDGLLEAADIGAVVGTAGCPTALVVPHAGYACSGPVAAAGYRLLRGCTSIRMVVLVGPAHFRDPRGIAVPESNEWTTPLGEVRIDQQRCARLVASGVAHRDDLAHEGEHSLEVQLPFLQRVLSPGWSCVPAVVRGVPAQEVADAIDELAGSSYEGGAEGDDQLAGSQSGAHADADLLVIASTDLSHYFDEATAARLDRSTAQAVLELDEGRIGDSAACGAVAVRGVVEWARRHQLTMELVDLRTSADTCSRPSRVVGYGAFAAFRST